MLIIQDLCVNVGEKQVLSDINLTLNKGITCIIGPNGSGKSSLAMAIMGHPRYTITAGCIKMQSKEKKKGKKQTYAGEYEIINTLSPDERAKRGIFLAFQNIPEIKGVKTFEFLRNAYNALHENDKKTFLQFKPLVQPLLQEVGLPEDFLWRDLYVGRSGGEKRKLELLQIKLFKPSVIILDEIDSGVDINTIEVIKAMLKKQANEHCWIVITHTFGIVENVHLNQVVLLEKGKVKEVGDENLINRVKREGF